MQAELLLRESRRRDEEMRELQCLVPVGEREACWVAGGGLMRASSCYCASYCYYKLLLLVRAAVADGDVVSRPEWRQALNARGVQNLATTVRSIGKQKPSGSTEKRNRMTEIIKERMEESSKPQ